MVARFGEIRRILERLSVEKRALLASVSEVVESIEPLQSRIIMSLTICFILGR